jgi:hypothetical protein
MTETGKTGNEGQLTVAGPPPFLVARATRRAEALGMCVYLYPIGETWIMTTHPGQLPATVAVWEIPANRNDSARQISGER